MQETFRMPSHRFLLLGLLVPGLLFAQAPQLAQEQSAQPPAVPSISTQPGQAATPEQPSQSVPAQPSAAAAQSQHLQWQVETYTVS